jgi:hypothetical protein
LQSLSYCTYFPSLYCARKAFHEIFIGEPFRQKENLIDYV